MSMTDEAAPAAPARPPVHELPGGAETLDARVLAALGHAGRAGASPAELRARLERRQEGEGGELPRGALSASLERLGRAGEAAESGGRWRLLAHTPWIAGTVERFPDGDGRVSVGPDEGYFVPRRRLAGALDGDRVLVEPRRGGGRRGGGRLPEASVVRILTRRHERLVGTLETGEEGRRWLVPYDPKNPLEVEVPGAESLPEDVWVEVEVFQPKGERSHPKGRVAEVLGPASSPGVDSEVVIRHHGIPDAFAPEVEEAAAAFPDDPDPADFRGREDLRGEVLVTIDGASARDFDDAVSLALLDVGGGERVFRVGVHIADVAQYVTEGSLLDREAYRRGNSVYFPERALPMLPEGLSNGLCSLRPGVPRLAVSAFLDFDESGKRLARRFAETVIESRRRLTYDEVRRVLEEPDPGDEAEYGEVLGLLHGLSEVMGVLRRRRRGRGALDFDFPGGEVELDRDGYTIAIGEEKANVAHKIIEELMIAANEAVAEELDERETPALYRVHEAPEEENLAGLAEVLEPLGMELPDELRELHPSHLQRLLEEAEGKPEETLVTTLVLRTLEQARYDVSSLGHYALAARWYTHFTSPIRRYPDLVVHRRMKALVRGGEAALATEARAADLEERLPVVAAHASGTERRAERAERELLSWKKVRFMAPRVGESFAGRITGVTSFGLFVRLEELAVDGLVPISTLGDDYFEYDEERHRLVGSDTGRRFRLGEPLRVVLTGIDERRRGLQLAPEEPVAARRGRRR